MNLYTPARIAAERDRTIAVHGVAFVEHNVDGIAIRISSDHPGSWLCRIVRHTRTASEIIN